MSEKCYQIFITFSSLVIKMLNYNIFNNINEYTQVFYKTLLTKKSNK